MATLGFWTLACGRAYGRQVPACPTVQKVHVTAEPLTHKFAPGFKWRTETNSRRLFPSKARRATFMATLGFWTLACGRAYGRQVPACPTVQKVHVTAEPLTHKFAPGFKWRTETN